MNKTVLKQPVALLFALFSFFLTGLFGVYWTQSNTQSLINNQQSILSDLSRAQASELERRLSAAFTSAQILAYEVEFNNGTTEWFEDYADKLIQSIGGIENLQLAPEGIISQIYPLGGNEAAIGLDIVSTPRFTTEAMAAIKSRSIFMIGPVPLVQGGVAVISRSPVLLNRDTQRELFWGFASAVVFLDDLLKTTQLIELEKQGYQYRLTRIETGSNLPIELFASEAPLTEIKASTDLVLPVGNWTLSVSLNLTEQLEDRTYSGYILTLIVASLLSSALYFLLMQPIKLAALVKEKTKELQKMAYNDPLTGLANRRFLQDNLPAILMENKDQQRLSAFIYFDLDNFKRINDTIGHDVGDQILTIVADRLNTLRGPSDLVMRLGGDEFGIFLNHVKDKAQVCEQASTILSRIRHPVKIELREYSLSTSLGIAMIPENGFDLVTVMQNADMALYQAKSQGKNQYAFYTEFMKTQNDNLIKAEEELSNALENGEFEVYFQPQFDLSSNQVFGAEALVRWNHPERGVIFPNDFIPLAENTGKIVDLGYWVLENSIAYLAQRQRDNRPAIQLHINLASEQLSDPHFVKLVQALLEQYQVPAHQLGFEVTETSILKDINLARGLLQAFKDMGICIAIDDFGTGYSSLAQLKNLPVSLLKIDRSFIMDLEHDQDDRKIVEAIIAMAHKLNIQVLAEGIETREQWKMLEAFQCDFGQGYYVSKAITVEEFNQGKPIVHLN